MSDELEKMLEEATGSPVMHNTLECVLRMVENKGCENCPHSLGCAKLASLKMLSMQAMRYQPKDFKDALSTVKQVTEISEKIMRAPSEDEIRRIL